MEKRKFRNILLASLFTVFLLFLLLFNGTEQKNLLSTGAKFIENSLSGGGAGTVSATVDATWLANYTNLVTSTCLPGQYGYGISESGTFLCTPDANGTATINYSILSKWANITDRPTTVSFFTNDNNYYNSTTVPAYLLISNWNSTNTSYLTSELNWNANYTDFLNKVSWKDVNNGTIVANEINWNANYSLVVPYTILNNGTYGGGISWATASNGTLAWMSNLSSYVLNTALNNGTYYGSFSNIGNWTLDKPNWVAWSQIGNGSLATINSIWNTLSNGTMALNSTLGNIANWNTAYTLGTNNTFAQLTNLNNGTYNAWSTLGNGTMATTSVINNGTYQNYYPMTNRTTANISTTVITVYNTTIFIMPLSANRNYTIECDLNTYGSASTIGTQFNLSIPPGFKYFQGNWETQNTSTQQITTDCSSSTLTSCVQASTNFGSVSGLPQRFSGLVEVGTSSGNFNLSMKGRVAGTVILGRGSYCKVTDADMGTTL